MMDNISGLFGHSEEFNDTLKKIEDMLLNNKSAYFDVEDFIDVVNYLLNINQYEKVRKIINIGLRQHPNSDELMMKDAHINIINKNFDRAKHILLRLIRTTNGNPEIYYYMGNLYLNAKNTKKAIRYFDSALSIADANDRIELLYLITDDLMDEEEFAHAINYLHQLLEIDKYDFEALMDLTTCYKEVGKEEKAIELCDNFLNRDPYNEIVWFHMGMLLEDDNEFAKAIDAYEYAVAIEPEYTSALFSLGLLHRNANQLEKSNWYFHEVIRIESGNPYAHFYIAMNHRDMGDNETAMTHFETTIAIEPSYAEAWFKIGTIYFEENHFEESLLYTKKAIKYDDGTPEYWSRFGTLMQILNHTKYAILAFKKVLIINPTEKSTRIHLAECYFKDKNYDKTISVCLEATETFNDSIFNFLYGAALLEIGETKKGLNQLKHGMEKDVEAFDEFVYFYPKIISFDAVKQLVNKVIKNKTS